MGGGRMKPSKAQALRLRVLLAALVRSWSVWCWLCVAITTTGIAVIAGVVLATDSKVLEKGAEEVFLRAVSTVNQWTAVDAPFVSDAAKASMGQWRADPGACVPVEHTFLAVGMRVPKSASSTLQDLVDELAPVNHYATTEVVQRHAARGLNRTLEEQRLARYLSGLHRRTVWTAHVPFIDFASLGFPRPVYFATLRDPIKRLVSHYNYDHFSAERPVYMQLLHQDGGAPPFARCVQGHMDSGSRRGLRAQRPAAEGRGAGNYSRHAVPSSSMRDLALRRRTAAAGEVAAAAAARTTKDGGGERNLDCVQTAGLQVRFFCGVREACRYPSEDTLRWAMANIDRHFAAVVVVEEMLLSFKVLEVLLPNLFGGLVDRYLGGDAPAGSGSGGGSSSGGGGGGSGNAGGGGGTMSRVNTAHKAIVGGESALSREQRRFLEDLEGVRLEYALYNHSRQRLHSQAASCNQHVA